MGTTCALAPRDLIASNSASIAASRVSHSLSFLSCSASAVDSAAEGWARSERLTAAGAEAAAEEEAERLLGVWRALVRGPLWGAGGKSGEALSRAARLEGAEEEPEALRVPDFLLLAPARRRDVAGSDAGESAAEGAASRRFSSIETRRRKRKGGLLGKRNILVSETVLVLDLSSKHIRHLTALTLFFVISSYAFYCFPHSLHSLCLL